MIAMAGWLSILVRRRVVKQPVTTLKPGTLDFDWSPHQPFADLVATANKEAVAAAADALAHTELLVTKKP